MGKDTGLGKKLAQAAALAALVLGAGIIGAAWAAVDDDSYEGNIFSLYGYNGALASPRTTLAESRRLGQPAFVVLYVNDSRDCKRQAYEVTQLQSRFGQQINFIAFNVDIFPQDQPELQKYYKDELPRLLLFDEKGELVHEATGFTPARQLEAPFRALVGRLPERKPVPPLLFESAPR